MWLFKWSQISKFLFLGAIAASLIACSAGGDPKKREESGHEDNGTFFIEKASVEKTGETRYKEISIPASKTFNFRTCFKDNQHSKAIINHHFEVEVDGKSQTSQSDANGCIKWSETITYNHLADAQWIEVKRVIKANGIQKGQRTAAFALNPWEDSGYSLMETRISDLKTDAQAVAALKGEGQQSLLIEDLRLQVDEKRITENGVVLNLEIRTIPSFSLKRTGGKRVLEPITYGEFEAEVMLINSLRENSKDVRRPITSVHKTKGKIIGGTLLIEQEVLLPMTVQSGQVQLALNVKPINAPHQVPTFSGVFNIAEYDQIKGSFFARLKNTFQDGSQTVDSYLTEKEPVKATSQDPSKAGTAEEKTNITSRSQVLVEPFVSTVIQYKNHNGLTREKVFSVKTCLKAPVDRKPLRNHVFQVQKINGQTESRTSNEEGCITWQDSVIYNLLETECWQSKSFKISSQNLSFNQNFELRINPWSDEPGSILDARHAGKQEVLCANGKSKIILTSYVFDKKQIDYEIDPYLNIKMKKEGIFKITGILKRPSLTKSIGYEEEPLPPGKYRLRWAIVDISVKDFTKTSGRIYQVGEKEVQIDLSGLVADTLTFESANLKALGNTNSLLLEIENLEKTENLHHATYRGTLILSNTTETSNLELIREGSDSLVMKIHAQHQLDLQKHKENSAKLASKEYLARNENLYYLNLKNEKDTEDFRKSLVAPQWWHSNNSQATKLVTSAYLRNWIQTGKFTADLANRFCGFWFQDHLQRPLQAVQGKSILARAGLGGAYFTKLCKNSVAKNPTAFFDIHYRYFMKNPAKVKNLAMEIKDVAFNTGFSVTQAHDVSLTKTWSADVNAGLSTAKIMEWLSPVSFSGGVRYSVAKATSDRTGQGNAFTVQTGEALLLEKLSFQMRSTAYEKCAVIKINLEHLGTHPKTWSLATDKNIPQKIQNEQLSRGLLICEGELTEKPVTFTETYYVLNQKNFYTQAIDPNSDLGRPLFMTFRGQHDYRRVMKALGAKVGTPQSPDYDQLIKQTQQSQLLPVFTWGSPAYPGQHLADE